MKHTQSSVNINPHWLRVGVVLLISGMSSILCGCTSQNTTLTNIHFESKHDHSLRIQDVQAHTTQDKQLLVSGVIVKWSGFPSPRNYGVEIRAYDQQGVLLTNVATSYFPPLIASMRPGMESRAFFSACLKVDPNLVNTIFVFSPPVKQSLKQ